MASAAKGVAQPLEANRDCLVYFFLCERVFQFLSVLDCVEEETEIKRPDVTFCVHIGKMVFERNRRNRIKGIDILIIVTEIGRKEGGSMESADSGTAVEDPESKNYLSSCFLASCKRTDFGGRRSPEDLGLRMPCTEVSTGCRVGAANLRVFLGFDAQALAHPLPYAGFFSFQKLNLKK